MKLRQLKHLRMPRPFATYYYAEASDPQTSYVSQGACKTEEGAQESAGVKLIRYKYMRAEIVDRKTGVLLWTFRRTDQGLRMSLGSGKDIFTKRTSK
jgi:hypothetical protein